MVELSGNLFSHLIEEISHDLPLEDMFCLILGFRTRVWIAPIVIIAGVVDIEPIPFWIFVWFSFIERWILEGCKIHIASFY